MYFGQKELERAKVGKRGEKHKPCMFEKAKTSIWLKQENDARQQLNTG